ncbi:hypothetical protein PRIPAC_96213 [Pristionchus pacificus]|uniref:Uncharacterized protein n=1 Tax=Pristionchus pacificus TaxID=54126 RepID=A0A454XTA9_PRIPA|nr:hypothetical protein PRIPAC_96213 [Pristionchus pacificus]|eukprot:PDM63695.1 hypothetical protein PRIPAC_49668 [Pristionchus pacificus]
MSDQWTHTDSMEDNSDWNNLDPIPLVNLLEDSTFEPAVHDEEIVSFSVEYGVADDGRHFLTLIVEYGSHLTHYIYRVFLD